MRSMYTWVLLLAIGGLASAPARGDGLYELHDLGVLPGGSTSRGYGVNDLGNVVGESTVGGGSSQAFYWAGGPTLRDLGTVGVSSSVAYAVNNNGQATGVARWLDGSGRSSERAFITDPSGGGMRPLSSLTGSGGTSQGRAINSNGLVVGSSQTASDLQHAVRWGADGQIRDLGSLIAGGRSEALGINSAGVAVGWSDTATLGQVAVRFRDDGGGMAIDPLGTLSPGGSSVATAINDAGLIAGYGSAADGQIHAFRYDPNAPTPMVDLQGSSWAGWSSYAMGLNGPGSAVGRMARGTESRAFLWTDSDGLVDLNSLLDPDVPFGWRLTAAYGINEVGQIVGTGTYLGQVRAFLLTPKGGAVPEPSSLILLGLGGSALAAVAVRRGRLTRRRR